MGKKNARIHRQRHHLCCHGIKHLVMSLFLLYLSGTIPPRNSAEVTPVPGTVHTNPREEGREVFGQSLIGSRPPSCVGRCKGCVRCMAVQVPVTPQQIGSHLPRKNLAYTRGDGISNYKPMTWKCKCSPHDHVT